MQSPAAQEAPKTASPVDVDDAPMSLDRTAGWKFFRDAGEVFESGGVWYLTTLRAVQFAHQRAEIFSSARAFEALASPVLLGRLLAIDGDGACSQEELLGLCFLFTLAGLDTVTAAIGFVLLHLASDPALRHRVASDPTLVGPAIEEVLRLELPAPMTPRVTQQDVEVFGTMIPAGSLVQLALGAANRDEDRFADPNTIDLDDPDRGHLSFGRGIHRCLGSHLARRELRIVVEEFHKRIPQLLDCAGSAPRDQVAIGYFPSQRITARLPHRWGTLRRHFMKVVIDAQRCTGHGRCYVLSPTIFSDDDRGHGQVIGDGTVTTPEQIEAAERAVRSCPERAISIS